MPVYQALGRREQGKTTLAYWMARQVRQRVVYDPRAIVTRSDGVGRVDRAGELPAAFEALAADRVSELVFTPGVEEERDFAIFVREVLAWPRHRPVAIVFDESGIIPLESKLFRQLLRTSPKPMSLIFTAHRPVDMPVLVRSLTDRWCVFQTKEPRDLVVLSERCSERRATVVQTLQAREFATWDDRGPNGTLRVHRDPDVWYMALDAVPASDPPLLQFRSVA